MGIMLSMKISQLWYLGLVVIAVGLMAAGCSNKSVPSGEVTQEVPAPGFENTVDEMVVNDANTVTVQYTGSAFSPSTATINVGDTVRFENTGRTAAVWPAANPHPIHTSVPGFDARRPLDTGGYYEFTFTKPGKFGYHNHLNPSQTGTIIVQ